jgi:hypothetical protein
LWGTNSLHGFSKRAELGDHHLKLAEKYEGFMTHLKVEKQHANEETASTWNESKRRIISNEMQ